MTPVAIISLSPNRMGFYSAQGRYQSRAAERIAVRGDHDLQPTSHDIMSSNSTLFHFIIELNGKQISQGVLSILFLSFIPILLSVVISPLLFVPRSSSASRDYRARITIHSSQPKWGFSNAFGVSDRVVSTFEKRPTPLHALKRNMNPTRSSQNNREQSQKWNVEERGESRLERRGIDE